MSLQTPGEITYPLKYQMNFVGQQNAYYISVESQVSINFILVQCDTNVQLMDVERNLAILSVVDHEKVCILGISHYFWSREI